MRFKISSNSVSIYVLKMRSCTYNILLGVPYILKFCFGTDQYIHVVNRRLALREISSCYCCS